jgi:hypothetical protein
MVRGACQQHVKLIRDTVLNDVCPRCKVAFLYESGCLALSCPKCKCGFCAFCMTDQGDDAHTHCAGCQHNFINREIFAPKGFAGGEVAFFAEVQRRRKTRWLHAYFANLAPDMRTQVCKAMAAELADLKFDAASH